MLPFAWVFGLACMSTATIVPAQEERLSDPCHAMPAKGTEVAKNFLTFDQFDKELRVALHRQDPLALAFLVTFPLRVNDAGGTISLDNAAALKTHFQEVFTAAVRKAILSEKNDALGCNEEGIGYGRGVIWVNASNRGYRIWSVNRDAVPPYPANQGDVPRTEYICQTQTHRIVVDTIGGGELRYRSWNKPRPITEAPDLEVTKGETTFEGTQACAVPIYTFKSGTAVYRVEAGLGCFEDPNGPPSEATGRLKVTVAGNPISNSWCY